MLHWLKSCSCGEITILVDCQITIFLGKS
jgi:hypothetical protein